jgi:hypothetical protein
MNDTQGQPWYVRVSKDVRAHRTVGGRCRGLNDMFSLCNKKWSHKTVEGHPCLRTEVHCGAAVT